MRVVDLADEFGITSSEALGLCDRLGIPAKDGGSSLTQADAEAIREAMRNPQPAEPVAALSGGHAPGGAGSPYPGAPLPPVPQHDVPFVPRPDTTSQPRARRRASRLNGYAIAALVCAFLPLAALYLGYMGLLLMVPTFWLAREANAHTRRAPGGATHSGLAILASVVVVSTTIMTMGVVYLARAGAVDKRPWDALADIVHPDTGPKELITPLPGDCLSNDNRKRSSKVNEISREECTKPHDVEVLEVYEVASLQDTGLRLPADGSQPGDEQLAAAVARACLADFEALVGTPYARNELGIIPLLPTDQAWAAGQHRAACAVGPKDGTRLTGSITGG